MTIVTVDNEIYGACAAMAHEIGATEIVVEMPYAPPIGTVMTVAIGDLRLAHRRCNEQRGCDPVMPEEEEAANHG